jgi:hypothetical protein
MFTIHCPQCRKELLVPNDRAGGRIRCSGCDTELQIPEPDADEPGGDPAYTLQTNQKAPDSTSNDRDYVDYLARKAAIEQERKPYIRSRFPVDLLAGLIFFTIGIGISLFVILEGGAMNMLVNGFLIPMIFFITGAGCILSWLK